MTDGLYDKYLVMRMDGRDSPRGDKSDAEYFVLDLVHDPAAQHAIVTYCSSLRVQAMCGEGEYLKELHDDLYFKYIAQGVTESPYPSLYTFVEADVERMDAAMDTMIDLHDTTDAQVWAREFLRIINDPELPEADPYDEGFMIGWFANAIATGEMASRDGL